MKKLPKHTKRGPIEDDRINKAKKLFLDKQGAISDSQLARIIGVHRGTIAAWKKAGGWNVLVAEIKHAIDKKVVEKAVVKYAEQSDQMFEEIFTNMRLLSLAARRKILQHDEKGRPLMDGTGQPLLHVGLSPADIRALSSTMEVYHRMTRLQAGQSTENTDTRMTGDMTTRSADPDPFEKAVRASVTSGNADAQDALAQLVELHQKVLAGSGG